MATRQSKVSSVLDKYGESLTVTNVTGETYSEDNGWTVTTSGSASTNCIPYDYFSGRVDYREQGNLAKGEVKLIVKGDFSIGEKDTFTYRTKTYQVTSVNPLPFDGEYLAQVIDAFETL